MRPELPDNAREAVQFLLLGAGALVLLRLGHGALDAWLAPGESDALGQAAVPFRRGYLLTDPHSIVPARTSTTGRLSLALLIGMAGGAAGALLSDLVQWTRGRERGRARWRAVRIGMVLCTATGIVSALFLPPQRIAITGQGIHVTERPAIAGTALPFPARKVFLPWNAVTVWLHGQAREGSWLTLDTPGQQYFIARPGTDAEADTLYAHLSRLQAAMRTH